MQVKIKLEHLYNFLTRDVLMHVIRATRTNEDLVNSCVLLWSEQLDRRAAITRSGARGGELDHVVDGGGAHNGVLWLAQAVLTGQERPARPLTVTPHLHQAPGGHAHADHEHGASYHPGYLPAAGTRPPAHS